MAFLQSTYDAEAMPAGWIGSRWSSKDRDSQSEVC